MWFPIIPDCNIQINLPESYALPVHSWFQSSGSYSPTHSTILPPYHNCFCSRPNVV